LERKKITYAIAFQREDLKEEIKMDSNKIIAQAIGAYLEGVEK